MSEDEEGDELSATEDDETTIGWRDRAKLLPAIKLALSAWKCPDAAAIAVLVAIEPVVRELMDYVLEEGIEYGWCEFMERYEQVWEDLEKGSAE
jgi:hypothetical protein